MENIEIIDEVEVVAKVSREEKQELQTIRDRGMVRFLVDQYYQSQQYRICAENQVRSLIQGVDSTATDTQPLFIKKELTNARAQEALNRRRMVS